jgi:hypothetical protein
MLTIFTRAGSARALKTEAVASASSSAIAGVPSGRQHSMSSRNVISTFIVSTIV